MPACPVVVTLRDSGSHVEVTRSQASLMRMRGTALSIDEERAEIRAAYKGHAKAIDKHRWHIRMSGSMGPLVMQMEW